VVTGWTECVAVPNRGEAAVREAIVLARTRLPFPLLGLDSDNGSEFINHHLYRYCQREQITFTRCRPYRKNDQCRVEQKNGAIVRQIVGYERYEGREACDALNALYAVAREVVNAFQPSVRLVGKDRVGSRVKKTYDAAQTPYRGVAKRAGKCEGVRMSMRTCPYCGTDTYTVKDGRNRSGTQRYRCRACPHAFTPTPKEQGHGSALHEQAVRLYLEGMSLRAIGRIFGVVHQSVANWVAAAAATLPPQVSDTTPSETVEVDELYTFIERKKGRHSS